MAYSCACASAPAVGIDTVTAIGAASGEAAPSKARAEAAPDGGADCPGDATELIDALARPSAEPADDEAVCHDTLVLVLDRAPAAAPAPADGGASKSPLFGDTTPWRRAGAAGTDSGCRRVALGRRSASADGAGGGDTGSALGRFTRIDIRATEAADADCAAPNSPPPPALPGESKAAAAPVAESARRNSGVGLPSSSTGVPRPLLLGGGVAGPAGGGALPLRLCIEPAAAAATAAASTADRTPSNCDDA